MCRMAENWATLVGDANYKRHKNNIKRSSQHFNLHSILTNLYFTKHFSYYYYATSASNMISSFSIQIAKFIYYFSCLICCLIQHNIALFFHLQAIHFPCTLQTRVVRGLKTNYETIELNLLSAMVALILFNKACI